MSQVYYSTLFTPEERKHRQIDDALGFVNRTGLCPVCRVRRKGHGITCGVKACVNIWLFPSKRFDGELDENSELD